MFADDMDDVADRVLLGGKDTVSICLITGFESFNMSLYNKVSWTPHDDTPGCLSLQVPMFHLQPSIAFCLHLV